MAPEELQELTAREPAVAERLSPELAPNWLRLAYVFEYLFAVPLGLYAWAQVGGEGHMDLLPWYFKLVCVTLLAWCLVRFTAAMVERQPLWNRSSRIWFGGVLLVTLAMGCLTFYYHLHEAGDESETDQTSAKSVRNVGPDKPVYRS